MTRPSVLTGRTGTESACVTVIVWPSTKNAKAVSDPALTMRSRTRFPTRHPRSIIIVFPAARALSCASSVCGVRPSSQSSSCRKASSSYSASSDGSSTTNGPWMPVSSCRPACEW